MDILGDFVQQQVREPGHPKTLIYHFAKPNPTDKPLEIEFTEVFLDEQVFWDHLDTSKDPKKGEQVAEAFSEKTRTWRRWNFYGEGDYDEGKTKSIVVDVMGANADGKKVDGFIVNKKVTKGTKPGLSTIIINLPPFSLAAVISNEGKFVLVRLWLTANDGQLDNLKSSLGKASQ